MKASRLLSILMLLQSHGRMTARVLAAAMEVSERTILRDIDQLSAAGVPLWGERCRAGGFQLREGWSTQLTGLTEPEANALLLAGLPSAATDLGLGAPAASARLKMVASLPAPWREQAARVGERLHIDPIDWDRAQDTPHFLREAADAVWRGRRISVRYQSWHRASQRELEPLGLVSKAGAWYLAAREAGQDGVRIWRLASVIDLRVGTRAFKRPRGFDLARWWRESSVRFESDLRRLQARVRLSARGMAWMRNARLPYVAVPGGEAGDVLLAIESVEQDARQLLAFGAEVEVVEPAALRQEVLRQARALVARHARPRSGRRATS